MCSKEEELLAVGLHHLSFNLFLLCKEPNHINFFLTSERRSFELKNFFVKHLFIVYYLQEFPPRASTPTITTTITTNIKTNIIINIILIIFDPRASSRQR
jgi:hypothetical protein